MAVKKTPPDPTTDQILNAALAEFSEFGFRKVTIGDVARRADMHRATVYRRFPTKDALVAAAMGAWSRRFFREISAAVAERPTFEERLVEGFSLSLQRMRKEPLVTRVLGTDSDVVLPLLTTSGGNLIGMVSDFFVMHFGDALGEPARARQTAEVAARLGLSFVLTRDSRIPLKTTEDIRAFAQRYILRLV